MSKHSMICMIRHKLNVPGKSDTGLTIMYSIAASLVNRNCPLGLAFRVAILASRMFGPNSSTYTITSCKNGEKQAGKRRRRQTKRKTNRQTDR